MDSKIHKRSLNRVMIYGVVVIYGGAKGRDDQKEIKGFVDFDYAGCMDTIKSMSGYVFNMFDTSINWETTL